MSKSFLVTRPKYEILTNLLFYWTEAVIDEAKQRGHSVLDLVGAKANRKTFHSYVKKNSPLLIFFNGHGSERAITGHNDEVLVEVDSGDELLKDSVVYARSCHAAKALGPSAVAKGAKAFIGYKREFTVAHSMVDVSRPLEDNLARLFIEPSNIVPISLLKGNSVGEAYKKSQKAMRRNLRLMLSSEATFEEQSVASYLWGNIKAQVVVGNSMARI